MFPSSFLFLFLTVEFKMYKPNFVLVGGVANKLNKSDKDFVCKNQINGNYKDIEDILMDQFKNLYEKDKGYEHQKRYAS